LRTNGFSQRMLPSLSCGWVYLQGGGMMLVKERKIIAVNCGR
jgi:hypothetical protein